MGYRFGILNRKSLYREIKQFKEGSNSLLNERVQFLLKRADEAQDRKLTSVLDKGQTPPSGDIHDYWTLAYYWWPNPYTEDGMPFIRKDGHQYPGTAMGSEGSEKYDRTRLKDIMYDGMTLALAWLFTGKSSYIIRAITSFELFFVDDFSRMNPNLNYAQVRMGWNDNQGCHTGIIEFRDIYFYLDAVQIMRKSGYLSDVQYEKFRGWLLEYYDWLVTSELGIEEMAQSANHGTYYDLQVLAIARFLEKDKDILMILDRVHSRINTQIDAIGKQPLEIKRTLTQHYCCFNLQAFLNIAIIASKFKIDLFDYVSPNGGSISLAGKWLIENSIKGWKLKQIKPFKKDRLQPIMLTLCEYSEAFREHYPIVVDPYSYHSTKFSDNGIRPFWNIGHRRKNISAAHHTAVIDCRR